MKLIIHRGTHNIGGTCIELVNDATRLIFDIGLPLNIDISIDADTKELEKYKPRIDGLYKDSPKKDLVKAVFVSHFHPDHSKFISEVHPDIPIYMSAGTCAIMKTIEIFMKKKPEHVFSNMIKRNIKIIGKDEKYNIGDFEIKPIAVDHSAPDALGFIIECNGKTIVYTGDFRDHGRKGMLLESFEKAIPNKPEIMLVEGTMVGSDRIGKLVKNESMVEDEVSKILKENSGGEWPVLVNFVPTNLDRLISFLRACIKEKVVFVIDLFTAYLYFEMKKLGWDIPDFDSGYFKVLFFNGHKDALNSSGEGDFMARVMFERIHFNELIGNENKLVLFRPGHVYSIEKNSIVFQNKLLLYSQYNGIYPGQEEKIEKYNSYLKNYGIKQKYIHTSGHIYIDSLKYFLKAVSPQLTIPIHTEKPELFENIFKDFNIKVCKDKEEIII